MRTRTFAAAGALALAGAALVAAPAQAAPITCTFKVGPVFYYNNPKPHQTVLVEASHLNGAVVTYLPTGQVFHKRLVTDITTGQFLAWMDLGKQGLPEFGPTDISVTVKGMACAYVPGDPSQG